MSSKHAEKPMERLKKALEEGPFPSDSDVDRDWTPQIGRDAERFEKIDKEERRDSRRKRKAERAARRQRFAAEEAEDVAAVHDAPDPHPALPMSVGDLHYALSEVLVKLTQASVMGYAARRQLKSIQDKLAGAGRSDFY